MSQDEQYLDLLAIFHYVVGGLMALFACIPVIHLCLGLALVCGAFPGKEAPPTAVGWLLVVLALMFILFGWALAGVMIATGRRLKRRRSYTFCLVVATIECLWMPLGTILGVFTIVMLMKDSVKTMFTAGEVPFRSDPSEMSV